MIVSTLYEYRTIPTMEKVQDQYKYKEIVGKDEKLIDE